MLDVEDVVPADSYTLEVSSPGLDRPLRHADDYRRFAGRLGKNRDSRTGRPGRRRLPDASGRGGRRRAVRVGGRQAVTGCR